MKKTICNCHSDGNKNTYDSNNDFNSVNLL